MMREPSNYDLIVPSRSSSDTADKQNGDAPKEKWTQSYLFHPLFLMKLFDTFRGVVEQHIDSPLEKAIHAGRE